MLSTADTAISTVVTITCEDGYEFSDGSSSISTQCESSGAWSTDYTQNECEGKYNSVAAARGSSRPFVGSNKDARGWARVLSSISS